MKIFGIIIVLQCQLIPAKYSDFWNLYKYLNPPDSIVFWEAGICNLLNQKFETVYCSDTTASITLSEFSDVNTYYSNYYSIFPWRFFLLFKTQNGAIRYINKAEQLIRFLGDIDNLPEALFLARMYGYSDRPGRKFGSYCYSNGTYNFNLYKILNSPGDLEDKRKLVKAKIKVDANGNVYEFAGKKNLKWRQLTVNDFYGH
jgi:hypothetical protein